MKFLNGDQHKLVIKVAEFTPEESARIIGLNTDKKTGLVKNYRKATPTVVKDYALLMENDLWELNGDTIVFGKDDKDLLNGQHRLLACIASGKSFESIVVWGAKQSVVHTFDQGKPRNLGNVLNAKGEDYAVESAIALRLIWLRTVKGIKVSGGGRFNSSIALNLLKEHEALGESVAFIVDTNAENEGQLKRCMSIGYLAALHYLFRASDIAGADTKADKFFRLLALDDKLTASQPVTALYKKLTGKRDEGQLTRDEKLGLAIKVWHAYVAGEDIARLTISKEEFPRVGGLDEAPEEIEEEIESEEVAAEGTETEEAPTTKRKRKVKSAKGKSVEDQQAEADYDADGGE